MKSFDAIIGHKKIISHFEFILLMKSMKSELMIFEKGSMRRSILNRIAEIIRFISLMMRIE